MAVSPLFVPHPRTPDLKASAHLFPVRANHYTRIWLLQFRSAIAADADWGRPGRILTHYVSDCDIRPTCSDPLHGVQYACLHGRHAPPLAARPQQRRRACGRLGSQRGLRGQHSALPQPHYIQRCRFYQEERNQCHAFCGLLRREYCRTTAVPSERGPSIFGESSLF